MSKIYASRRSQTTNSRYATPLRRAVIYLGLGLLSFVGSAFAQTPSGFVEFSPAGAGSGSGEGTIAEDINYAGTVVGHYYDSVGASHGFVRSADGTITVFDVNGAGVGPSQGTYGFHINGTGAVAGDYANSNNVTHGFLRSPSGTVANITVSVAGKGNGEGTVCCDINGSGATAGSYLDN